MHDTGTANSGIRLVAFRMLPGVLLHQIPERIMLGAVVGPARR